MERNIIKGKLMLIIIMLILTISIGTLAWLAHRSKNTAIVFTIGDFNNSKITIKPYQIKKTLTPTLTHTSGVFSQITVINNNGYETDFSLFYKINDLNQELINNGLKYTIEVSNTVNSGYSTVKTGSFSGITDNRLTILEEEISANTTIYYRVYIWLDSNEGNQNNLQNTTLDIELNAEYNKAIYTLTYNPTGGIISSGQYTSSIIYNNTYGTLPIPTKEGFQFEGWYTAESGGTQITPSTRYTQQNDQTIYARWIALDFTNPTCTLGANDNTITAIYSDEGGSGVSYYGWNPLYTGENSTTATIDSTGIKTFYVMDGAGNTNTCSGTVTATTEKVTKSCSGNTWWHGAFQSCCLNADCSLRSTAYIVTTTTYSCSQGTTKLNDSYCWQAN